MTRALGRRPALALLAGLALGALVLALVPTGWLFRDPPIARRTIAGEGRQYACPMFCTMDDAPGTCPVCGMQMEPVKDFGTRVPLTRRERYMVGVRTALAQRTEGVHFIRALGHIRHDERRMGHVTAWVGGRLDRLYVDFTGIRVAAGEQVAEIYAPELVSAQEELLTAKRTLDDARAGGSAELASHAASVYGAARRRLRLLGLPDAFVDAVEAEGEARDRVGIQANVGGTVIAKRVNTGDYVKTGDTLFSVVDLSVVWAMLEVFEEDAGSVFVGQRVEVEVPSLPGERFTGRVSFVDPELDERRRVVEVRVDLPNPRGRLKPGTFVDAHIRVELASDGTVLDPGGGTVPGQVLVIPRSAVLDGGERQIVYVMTQEPGPVADGTERWPAIYEPREIRTSFRVGEMGRDVVVLDGLEAGDLVVTRGQFLIDSQLQLTGKPSLMIPEAAGAPAASHAGHAGH